MATPTALRVVESHLLTYKRTWRFGLTTSFVSPVLFLLGMGVGLDLDLVVVLGLAEGFFPGPVRDDSLLPDAERRATDGVLPLRSSRVDDDHRRCLDAP